jgi:glycosyltransferase involved in cell wall biosynthesis
LKAVESIKSQTYQNIEIIVINDGSTDAEYKNIIDDVVWVNLPQNSKDSHGFKSRSYVCNYGVSIAKGDYIAFCDDDDAWYPSKIETQLSEMQRYRSGMSCTEANGGRGEFNIDKKYKLYTQEIFKGALNKKTDNGMPKFVDKNFLSKHNFLIGSSVVIEKEVLDKVGYLNEDEKYKKGQDFELWKRVLSITDCVYINDPLTYYDLGHGNGRQY